MPTPIYVRDTCSRCREKKTPDDFYVDRSRLSGRRSVCKVCQDKAARAYAKGHGAAVVAALAKKYSQSEAGRANARAWRKTRKPDLRKRAVHNVVARAVKSGKLTRQSCVSCGGWPVDAHHADYSKPLEVQWLCRRCHARHHTEATHAL